MKWTLVDPPAKGCPSNVFGDPRKACTPVPNLPTAKTSQNANATFLGIPEKRVAAPCPKSATPWYTLFWDPRKACSRPLSQICRTLTRINWWTLAAPLGRTYVVVGVGSGGSMWWWEYVARRSVALLGRGVALLGRSVALLGAHSAQCRARQAVRGTPGGRTPRSAAQSKDLRALQCASELECRAQGRRVALRGPCVALRGRCVALRGTPWHSPPCPLSEP